MAATITTWTSLIQQFLPIFTQPGATIFTRLAAGWILCTVRRTITGILPFADPAGIRAHDAYHRFFPDARWNMARLWQALAMMLIATCCRSGIITLALANIDRACYRDDRRSSSMARRKTLSSCWRRFLRDIGWKGFGWSCDYFQNQTQCQSVRPAAEVLECYNDRWAIEDTFKNTKQFLGSQHPQTWKRQGPERAACLSLWLYSLVWLWYLLQKSNRRTFIVQPWNPLKASPSFADALCCLCRKLWSERIKCMFGEFAVHDKKFQYLLEALAPAA